MKNNRLRESKSLFGIRKCLSILHIKCVFIYILSFFNPSIVFQCSLGECIRICLPYQVEQQNMHAFIWIIRTEMGKYDWKTIAMPNQKQTQSTKGIEGKSSTFLRRYNREKIRERNDFSKFIALKEYMKAVQRNRVIVESIHIQKHTLNTHSQCQYTNLVVLHRFFINSKFMK